MGFNSGFKALNYLGSVITSGVKLYTGSYIQDCHGKSNIWQEEGSFLQQIGLKFEEEPSKVLHLEYSFVWSWHLNVKESRSEICFGMWCWRRTEKIGWTDRVGNEDGLRQSFRM